MQNIRYARLFVIVAAIGLGAEVLPAQVNSTPTISQPAVPTAVPPGSPGFALTVNGTGFTAGSTVKWNGSSRSTQFISGTELTTSILESDVAQAGTALVTVTSPSPGGGTSNVAFLQVSQPLSAVGLSGSQLTTGALPIAVAAVDANLDGKLDLAVANSADNTVSVLLGNGDGTFQPQKVYSTAQGPTSIAAGDFNGDGKVDLAIGTSDSGMVSILLGNGDGTFQPHKDYLAGFQLFSLVTADIDNDGKLDLIVADEFDKAISILIGNGDGTFKNAFTVAAGPFPSAVAAGDLNRDGRLDLVVTDNVLNQVMVLLGNGDGTFQPPAGYAVGTTPGSPVIADFNGDGTPDLGVSNFHGNTVSILLGNGDGTLQPRQDVTVGVMPAQLQIGDFNADGKLDFLTADVCGDDPTCAPTSPGTVSVVLGNGDGSFQTALGFPTVSAATALAAGDFNRDGKLEVAVGGLTFAVVLETTAALSPATPAFPDEIIGMPSPPQTVTLTNTAKTALNIASITEGGANPGDFSQTNNCPPSLVAGASCTFTIVFTPSAEGTRTALIGIADDALGSPQNIALTGTGVAPIATLSATSLTFPTQLVFTFSPFQAVGLTNTGNASLNISSIVASGDFHQRGSCGAMLAPGASCTLKIYFKPTHINMRAGSVIITDNAVGGQQTISLTGQGTFFDYSPTSLSFGSVKVGMSSQPQTVTLTNVAVVPQQVVFAFGGGNPTDFSQTNNCGSSIPAKGTCTINVTFAPTKVGSRSAKLQIGGGGGTMKTVLLSGSGTQ